MSHATDSRSAPDSEADRDVALAVGVDLAWSPKNRSGFAAAIVRDEEVVIVECSLVGSLDDIVSAVVDVNRGRPTTIAIDCPTIVPNETGMRPCERVLQRQFARSCVGPYPANRDRLGRYNLGTPRGEELSAALQARLQATECGLPPSRHDGVYVIEVFPAPSHVRLFALEKGLLYKKKAGRGWGECGQALCDYIDGLHSLMNPRLILPPKLRFNGEKGQRYKDLEDQLDAVMCAYVAALAWLDSSRVEMIGSITDGYVVIPRRVQGLGSAESPTAGCSGLTCLPSEPQRK